VEATEVAVVEEVTRAALTPEAEEARVDTSREIEEIIKTITGAVATTTVAEITTIKREREAAIKGTITEVVVSAAEVIKATMETAKAIKEITKTAEAIKETTIEAVASTEEATILISVVAVASVAEVGICRGVKTLRPLEMLLTNSLSSRTTEVVVAIAEAKATEAATKATTEAMATTIEEGVETTDLSRATVERNNSVPRALAALTTLKRTNLPQLMNHSEELT